MSDKPLSPLAQARLEYPVCTTHILKEYSRWPSRTVLKFCPEPDWTNGREKRWQEMPKIVVPYCVYGKEPAHLRVAVFGHEPGTPLFTHESKEYINRLLFKFVGAAWEFPRVHNWMQKLFTMLDAQECRNKKEVA